MPVKGEIMATQFQGIADSYDFAYGINPSAPAGLQVINGSNAAGTYTVTCSPANLTSADGLTITLSTATSITIGADSNIETVFPTSVSKNQLGQYLITAVFANAHSTGDVVRSGSGGILEANLAVHLAGGGLVSIGPASGAAVGATTTALLNTYLTTGGKTGWANTVLLNYLGFGGTAAPANSYVAGSLVTPTDGGAFLRSAVQLY